MIRDSTGDRIYDDAYDRRGRAYYEAAFARASALRAAESPADVAAAQRAYRDAIRRAGADYRADTSFAAQKGREG